jgi:K+-transporting ATPase ATPase C chain
MKALARLPRSLVFLFWMTVLTGLAYPLAITGLALLLYPAKAGGSLVVVAGHVRGSSLLAQDFKSPRFFKARPSATGYVYSGSGGSNLAPTNAALAAAVGARRAAFEASFASPAPADMVYASGSGLDPDISLASARGQLASVAAARGLSEGQGAALAAAIEAAAARKTSLIGPPRVNVVELNALLETDPVFAR